MAVSNTEVVLRLLLASTVGLLFGLDRERAHKPAGVRTYIIVCLASCVLSLVSAYGFPSVAGEYDGGVNLVSDPARLMVGILPALREAGVCVRHQTGVKDEAEVKQAYADAGMDASLVSAFIDDMAQAYAWADLVLCRAGASTVAELCGAGLPSVLVPYPYAAHDHQTGNAKALESAGAARLLPERDLDEAKLADTLLGLLADPGTLKAMSEKALALAAPGAAAGVADQIEEAWRRAEG